MAKYRSRKGQSIAEGGPAIFILVVMMFFPMLDLLGLGLAFYSGFMLNTWQTREAALISNGEATAENGRIRFLLPEYWRRSGQGKFANIDKGIATKVTYEKGAENAATTAIFKADQVVRVTTTIKYRPWFTIPFLPVPGLGDPFVIEFSNTRLVEDPDLASDTTAPAPTDSPWAKEDAEEAAKQAAAAGGGSTSTGTFSGLGG